MNGFTCETCRMLFSTKGNLIRHKENAHDKQKSYECSKCSKRFGRKGNVIRHVQICNGQQQQQQPSTSSTGLKRRLIENIEDQQQPSTSGTGLKRRLPTQPKNTNFKIYKTQTAFDEAVITWKLRFVNNNDDNLFIENIEDAVDAMRGKITVSQERRHAIKANMALHLIFEKATDPTTTTEPPIVLPSEQFEVYSDTNIVDVLTSIKEQLINRIDVFETCGSGWILSKLVALDTTIWQLDPLRASSTFHPLPSWIRNKSAVINVQNKDLQCFKWSVLAALHKNEVQNHHKCDTYSYKKFDNGQYDFSMLSFPVKVKDIHKFEKKNNISINVYGVEQTQDDNQNDDDDDDDDDEYDKIVNTSEQGIIYPLKVTKKEVLHRHVNLLITENDKGLHHYSAITGFSALVGKQYNNNDHEKFFCYTCLHGFKKKKGEETREDCKLLVEHRKYCKTLKPQRTEYPQGNDTILEFTNIHKQLKAPFVVYCDFESALENNEYPLDKVKTGIVEGEELEPKEKKIKKSKENAYQTHKPVSWAYKIVSIDPKYNHEIELFKGEYAAERLIDSLQKEAQNILFKYIENPKKIKMTSEDQKNYDEATICHICEQEVEDVDDKVRDHCHVLGTYRGMAHSNCNLNYRITAKRWKLPIFFHNLRGYDGHMIIKALQERHGSIRVIPTNIEKYLSITVGRLQFLDSMQFVAGRSLADLAETLKDDEEFRYTKEAFPKRKQFKLVKKKGIFPYDFLDHIHKLKHRKFPSRKKFFNTLADTECTKKDYKHAKRVWKTFKCKSFEDYHDIYLKTDVVLLADFFEQFRNTCLKSYGLDAAHYFSAPGLAWDSALKMTKIKLELIDNEEMHSYLERSIRGGICMITKRQAKANNPGCKIFDPTKPITYLIYLDANNLYGWAMSQSMPTHQFQWLTKEEIINNFDTPDDIISLSDNDEDGYIFEMDLEYPKELHDLHNDYPLAPERLKIDKSMLSPFQKAHFPSSQIKDTQIKLTPNLRDKERYVVHYRNLKYYLQQGLKIKKIHRVLKFKQSPWLKQYIDYNTQCRTLGKSDFEKDFYKLMNNSVFGKTNENLRNRVNIQVITNAKIALKRVAKPNFERSQTIRDDLVIIQSKITNLILNKPLYVGFSVLELSKLLMYQFHYDKMLHKYQDIDLCFTDTDSLLYEVTTNDIYKDMKQDNDEYDFSEYPFLHPNFDIKNKKIIGKMKDELNGMILEEFLGPRPKCYSLLFNGFVKKNTVVDMNQHQSQKSKGTKKCTRKAHLRHLHFKDCLDNLKTINIKQNIIKSKKHTVSSYHVNKVALTAFDTKRWIEDDNINTLAYGHYKTIERPQRNSVATLVLAKNGRIWYSYTKQDLN